MNLGENIYKFRTEKNMSQGDLADALNVSRQSVSKWENNAATPELDKLIKMSELFQITLDELVGRDAAPTAKPEPQPPQSGLTVADLISILLLLFGVLIPIVILATSRSHNSLLLMVLALFIIPPLVTICAAVLTPMRKPLFWAFTVYDIIFGILAAIAGNVLAPIVAIVYVFAVAFWNDRRS